MNRKPIAVLISDIHYRVDTLHLADKALRQAIDKAASLKVPLYICGDLNDTKAIIRGEVAAALIKTLNYASDSGVYVTALVGNHDLINEKGSAHSLEFIKPYADVVQHPVIKKNILLIPYLTNPADFYRVFVDFPELKIVIAHQGITGSKMGAYVIDHSAVDKTHFCLSGRRIISGHYHAAQNIELDEGGLWSYIGNPYSLTFGEANDGPKGFQVLFEDGSLEQVPTGLRKHVIEDLDIEGLDIYIHTCAHPSSEDLFWLKVRGPMSELEKLNKKDIGNRILKHSNFKFDKIATDEEVLQSEQAQDRTSEQLMDDLIDTSPESDIQKKYLKALWREVSC